MRYFRNQRKSLIPLVYTVFEFINVLKMYVITTFRDKLINKQKNLDINIRT